MRCSALAEFDIPALKAGRRAKTTQTESKAESTTNCFYSKQDDNKAL